jgi:molecular chaperone GrpE
MERDDKTDRNDIQFVEAESEAPEAGNGAVTDDGAIQAELGRLHEELERLREMYLRKLADFDNYRKRQERDLGEYRKHANAELLADCLPVLDNLERALEVPAGGDVALRTGVELVLRQLKDVLAKYGLEEIDPIGGAFDPAVHEAIERQEQSGVEHATVVRVFQKGYALHERLLRPALVVVAVPAERLSAGPAGDAADGDA